MSDYVSMCAEIVEFKKQRIAYFKKHLIELVELELKHAKVMTY